MEVERSGMATANGYREPVAKRGNAKRTRLAFVRQLCAPWRLQEPAPQVLLQGFGSSSVDFGVYLSVGDPWAQRVYQSDLRQAIWFAFKDAGITIAFPQLDVHFDAPVVDAMERLGQPAVAR